MMLCSGQSWDEQREVMARLRDGFRGLLYVAPERFNAPGFLSIITQRKLSLLAIDEAHCISQWGHDFRPEYLRLGEVRKQLGDPLTIALTATATPEVRTDIVRNLELKDRGHPRHRLRPPEPQLSVDRVCQGEEQAGRADRLSFAAKIGRHSLLLHPQTRGRSHLAAREQAARANHCGLSRGHGPGGARQQSTPLHRSRRCDCGGDQRVRHGHQQAQPALRDSLQSAGEPGSLLPGGRTRWTRRTAQRSAFCTLPWPT